MVSLKGAVKGLGLAGLVFGAFTYLSSNVAHARGASTVVGEINQCYAKNNWPSDKRCAKSIVFRYADELGNKDNIADPLEVKEAIFNIRNSNNDLGEKVAKIGKIKIKLNKAEKLEKKQPKIVKKEVKDKPELKVDSNLEKIKDFPYSIEILVHGSAEPPYAAVTLFGKPEFRFYDNYNDGKFDDEKDCLFEDKKKFCGEDIKKTKAKIDGKDTTHEKYYSGLREFIITAHAQYLIKTIDERAVFDESNDEYNVIEFNDGKRHYKIVDYGKNGTDTFEIREGHEYGNVIFKINKDESLPMHKIIGGLYNTLINKIKPVM